MDDYITTGQAAEVLNESVAEVYARVNAGSLVAWRTETDKGPVVRLRREDVAALAAAGRAG